MTCLNFHLEQKINHCVVPSSSSRINQSQHAEISKIRAGVLVARPLMEIQCSKGDRGRERRERRRKGGVGGCNSSMRRGYRVLIVSLIRSLCKSQQSQEMPGPWLQLIATAITKKGFL